jgi:glutaminase
VGDREAASSGLALSLELQDLYESIREISDGELATYIPPLADADPSLFGLAIVTVDGHCYSAGDTATPFTIQSVSKPFAFGLALDDLGVDALLSRVGVEPTGDAFNSITVDEVSGRPFNPMVNAGAIVTTSLLGATTEERDLRLLDGLSRFAGRTLDVDELVFDAERLTGDRNRAIAYLMRTFGMLRDDVDTAVESYFRQCSVLVDVCDLAVMGATLANDGVNPRTGERALRHEHVPRVLSVMSLCGMYDYAGEWLYRIGLPAKSGVSGGVVAVLPGVLAIASYSPPLDARGNSVRGIRACEELARRYRLHVFDGRPSAPVVRRVYDGSVVSSKRGRPRLHADALRACGQGLKVMELQGPLHFGSAEAFSRAFADECVGASHLVLDLSRVTSVDPGALPVISATVRGVEGRVTVVTAGRVAESTAVGDTASYRSLDVALERCEDEILELLGVAAESGTSTLADQELLDGLADEEIALIAAVTTVERFAAGRRVFREGDVANSIYFVVSGRVSVGLEVDGRAERLTTIGPGGCFGEMAAVDGGLRSTNVDVELDATCHVLPVSALKELAEERPDLVSALYRNLSQTLSRRLRAANGALRVLQA